MSNELEKAITELETRSFFGQLTEPSRITLLNAAKETQALRESCQLWQEKYSRANAANDDLQAKLTQVERELERAKEDRNRAGVQERRKYLPIIEGLKAADPIVEAVRRKLLQRSEAGLKKYGVGLDRTDLSPLDWLRHLQDELLDGANYAEKEIQRLESLTAENAKSAEGAVSDWPADGDCGCHKCNRTRDEATGFGQLARFMIVCPTCGNKRCPHASDHTFVCTHSNAPGQVGSVY